MLHPFLCSGSADGCATRDLLCRARPLPHGLQYDSKDPLHASFVDVLASLRLRVLGGSSVAAEDETEDSEPVRRDSAPHNAVANTREAATAQVVRSVTRGRDRWARMRPSPEEFDKVPNPLDSANALG
jgi:hypothetical protein